MRQQQQNLFQDNLPPWEVDDGQERLVATVVLPTGPDKSFDYLVPEPLLQKIQTGCRVQVPFGPGNRLLTAYCVQLELQSGNFRKLKAICHVLDQRSLLSKSMLRLTRWIADHYLCNWGPVLDTVVPAGVRGQAGTRYTTLLAVPKPVIQTLDNLKLPPKQALALRTLAHSDHPLSVPQLARLAGCTRAPLAALRKKGLIEARLERIRRYNPAPPTATRIAPLELNADQQAALRVIHTALNSGKHQTVLVHGVTGSGKTEVYIQAIEEVVASGRQAIVLVPEISLTPQTKERFRARFDRVAVLHSHLSDAERHWQWEEIAQGRIQVVVGARSAIFAPTTYLGLVVLDEEHESSFKQETMPRYHARDVARQRTKFEGVPLILGSATPSLETIHAAREGTIRLAEMPRRVLGRPLPSVNTIDLRVESRDRHSRGALSRQLYQAMRETLRDGGQILLLLNRRGFSTHIQCPSCGQVAKCAACDVSLTHHRRGDLAICHYCDYRTTAPTKCSECGFTGIRYSGLGTQRLETEVRARFPDAPCLRMDTDSMQSAGSHETALAAFRRGEIRILLGTQMIAKGLDFPRVTLVGVVNADTALHIPDFRAAERTFQLVTQVAGRTGRGKLGGRVLVQTFSPDHPAIQAAKQHDYHSFVGVELAIRKSLGYPPFSSMIRLVIRGPVEQSTWKFSQAIAQRLRDVWDQKEWPFRLLGPAPTPIPRLRGHFRFHIQFQGPDGDCLRTAVSTATADLRLPDRVIWTADVDPLEMM